MNGESPSSHGIRFRRRQEIKSPLLLEKAYYHIHWCRFTFRQVSYVGWPPTDSDGGPILRKCGHVKKKNENPFAKKGGRRKEGRVISDVPPTTGAPGTDTTRNSRSKGQCRTLLPQVYPHHGNHIIGNTTNTETILLPEDSGERSRTPRTVDSKYSSVMSLEST